MAHLYLHGHRLKGDFEVRPDEERVRYVNEVNPRGQGSKILAKEEAPEGAEEGEGKVPEGDEADEVPIGA